MAFLPLRFLFSTQEPVVVFPTVQLPSPNAFDKVMEASKHIKNEAKILDAAPPAATPPKNAPVVSLGEKQALLQENAPVLRSLREGLILAYYEPPAHDDEILYSHYRHFRVMAKLLVVDGDVQFQHGDQTAGITSCLDAVQLGQAIPRGGTLITRLVAIACQAVGRKPMWNRLDKLNAAAAKAGAHRMEVLNQQYVPMGETWAGEKHFMQASLLKSFRDPQKMVGIFDDDAPAVESDTPKKHGPLAVAGVNVMYMVWSKKYLMHNTTAFMDALVQESQKPYEKAVAPKPSFDPVIIQSETLFDQARLKDADGSQAQNALLCAALARQAYRADHQNRDPTQLTDLIPAYLSRLPDDPYALPIAPLRFQNGVLYSVGPDGKDDNGAPVQGSIRRGGSSMSFSFYGMAFTQPIGKGDIVAKKTGP